MFHKINNKHHKIILLIILLALIAVMLVKPESIGALFIGADYSVLILVLLYLPAFFVLIGLIEVWIPEKFMVAHLGKHSGFKGAFYSFIMGSLIPGPIYLSFPIAVMLLRKKVSLFNVALFIGAWSCFKVSEEIFELQFLGLKFFILRLVITIPFVVLSAFIIDRLHLQKG